MFGKTPFNRTLFNRASGQSSAHAEINSSFALDSPKLSVLVDLGEQSVRAAFSTNTPDPTVMVPISATDIQSEFSLYTSLGLLVNLQIEPIEAKFSTELISLRIEDAEELTLADVGFLPGDSIIIDTDQIDVQINGEPDVESWVSGSVFFLLKPGTDVIEILTNPESVTLEVRIQWADRYL